MRLILIDGGPASGKNTLGALLVQEFHKLGEKAVLLDLDSYVEVFNPTWVWQDKRQEEEDKSNARVNWIQDISKHLQENCTVIAIGKRFLAPDDVAQLVNRLQVKSPTYLYHLSVPMRLWEQRLHQRGPHSLIDLDKDQRDRDAVTEWPGFVYENINSPGIDAMNLLRLIRAAKGRLHN